MISEKQKKSNESFANQLNCLFRRRLQAMIHEHTLRLMNLQEKPKTWNMRI